jgi:two-component system nitrogen regulation sensor histidine kinase GlnL
VSEPAQGAFSRSARQIAGLTFALLLLAPDLTIAQVNPAAENLIGRSARRLIGQKVLEVVTFAENRIIDRLMGEEAQLVARGLAIEVDRRTSFVNLTVSSLAGYPGWRVVTLSDAGRASASATTTAVAARCVARRCSRTRSRTRFRPSAARRSWFRASSTTATAR